MSIRSCALPLLAVATAGSAFAAQEMGRVVSSTPVVQQVALPQQVCSNQPVLVEAPRSGAGALLGAIAGGAAGNAIGGGSGRAAATALGLVGGALLGDRVEGGGAQWQNAQQCGTQTTYENRTVGYDVAYEYNGRRYTTRTDSDPGGWIPLQVAPMAPAANIAMSPGYTGAAAPMTVQPGIVISGNEQAQTYPVQPQVHYQQYEYRPPVATYAAPGYVAAPVYVAPSVYYGRPAYYPPVGVSLNLGFGSGGRHHRHGHGHRHGWR